ncbi:MAG TPA: hypothetical protein VFM02_02945 [Candidatus Paceibacterota bacterium]|nr:hypothetical protein [Candidatus Paceibacterota bacterium]
MISFFKVHRRKSLLYLGALVLLAAFIFSIFFLTASLNRADAASTGAAIVSASPCHAFTSSNFPLNQPGYENFGVPYDVTTSSNSLLISILCYSDQYYMNVGFGNTQNYIWKQAYITTPSAGYAAYQSAVSHGNDAWCASTTTKNSDGTYLQKCTKNGASFTLSCPYEMSPSENYVGEGAVGFQDSCVYQGSKLEWKPVTLQGPNSNQGWFIGNAYAQITKDSSYPATDPTYFLAYTCSWTGQWKCGCRTASTCTAEGQWQLQEVPPEK